MECMYTTKGRVFVSEDNYIYVKRKEHGNTLYLKCRDFKRCGALCILSPNRLVKKGLHTHGDDSMAIEDLRFKTALAWRSRTEITPLTSIFAEEQIHYKKASQRLPNGFLSVKSIMQRARKGVTPPIPSNLAEAGNSLANPDYQRFARELGPLGRSFFYRCIERCVYFTSKTVFQVAKDCESIRLHINSPFKVVPGSESAHQLFMIQLLHGDSVYPMMYVLMEENTYETYVDVFRVFNEVLGNKTRVDLIMADYETALRKAVKASFHNCSLVGSWFLYAKQLFLKAREMGIADDKDEHVRMAMAIPLLPSSYIDEAIDLVCDLIRDTNFTRYMNRKWRRSNVSVFGMDHKINISVETFHTTLMKFFSRVHQNFWVFVECLQKYEHYNSTDLNRVFSGMRLVGRADRGFKEFTRRISAAQDHLEKTNDIEQFLKSMDSSVVEVLRYLNPQNEKIKAQEEDDDMPPNDIVTWHPLPQNAPLHEAEFEAIEDILIVVESGEFDDDLNHTFPDPQANAPPSAVPEANAGPSPDLQASASSEPDEIVISDNEQEDLAVNGRCLECAVEPAMHAMIPCGHAVYCDACLGSVGFAANVETCPQCSSIVQVIVRLDA